MSRKLCHEFLNCWMTDCPSFNNKDNDKCWILANTLCKDPVTGNRRPKSVQEKTNQCFGICKYREYRKELGV